MPPAFEFTNVNLMKADEYRDYALTPIGISLKVLLGLVNGRV
jgi:hypothetical protein